MSDENVRNARADIEAQLTRPSNISEELLQNGTPFSEAYLDVDWTMTEGDEDAPTITARPRHPSGVGLGAQHLHDRLHGVRVPTQQTLQELEAHIRAQLEPHVEDTIRGRGWSSGLGYSPYSAEEESHTVNDAVRVVMHTTGDIDGDRPRETPVSDTTQTTEYTFEDAPWPHRYETTGSFSERNQAQEEHPTMTLSFEGALLHLTLKMSYPLGAIFKKKNIEYDQEEFEAFTDKLCEHAIEREFFKLEDIERFVEDMYGTKEMHRFSGIISDLIINLIEKMKERSPDFHDNHFLLDSNILQNHRNYHSLMENNKDVSSFLVDQAFVVSTLSGHLVIPVFTKKSFEPKESQKSKLVNEFSKFFDDAEGMSMYTMSSEKELVYTLIRTSHISSVMFVPVDAALKYLNVRHHPKPLPPTAF